MQVRYPTRATRDRSPLAVLGMLAALLAAGILGYGLASASLTGQAIVTSPHAMPGAPAMGRPSGSEPARCATPDPLFAVT